MQEYVKDPFPDEPCLKTCQIVITDDQLYQLITRNECEQYSGNRHDHGFRQVPDHIKDCRHEITRCLSYFRCDLSHLVIHRGKRIGEVVHDSRYKNALQPVSNLLNYAVQLFPPFLLDRDFPCPMIQT